MFGKKKADSTATEHRSSLRFSISRTGVVSVTPRDLSENTDVRKQVEAAKDIPLPRAVGTK